MVCVHHGSVVVMSRQPVATWRQHSGVCARGRCGVMATCMHGGGNVGRQRHACTVGAWQRRVAASGDMAAWGHDQW